MPLTLIPISHGTLCHGSRWTVSDEDDLASKVARLALGQTRHVAAILTGIDKRPPVTRADTAAGAIKLLTVPKDKPPYHRDGWVFQAISWIAAHRADAGAVIRAPHMIHAHNRRAFMTGALINLLNPKAYMFFVVVAPQFLNDEQLSLGNALLLSVVSAVIATAIHCAIVLAGSRAQAWFTDGVRTRWVRRGFAVIILGVAVSFLLIDVG